MIRYIPYVSADTLYLLVSLTTVTIIYLLNQKDCAGHSYVVEFTGGGPGTQCFGLL